ncbi:DUF6544 family protein [Lutibacter sp.]|uniref:DUF6920 family protein n=1 Tax=Lutibacter sp. TaxID=1925666 RepID=UPI00349FD2F5
MKHNVITTLEKIQPWKTWFVTTQEYKKFDGFKIPTKCSVFWKLKEGDFNWLDFEIFDVKYNTINLDKKMNE